MEELNFGEIAWRLLLDFQTGFFYYTLVYFGLRFFKPKQQLQEFDRSAAIVIRAASFLVFAVWMGGIFHAMNLSGEDRSSFVNRATGPYAFAYWLQPSLYTIVPQCLWWRKIRENYLMRFVVAFFLFFNFEKFVILVTSLHRDYLPSSWSMQTDSYLPWIIFGILWKLGIFTAMAAIVFSMRAKKDTFAS